MAFIKNTDVLVEGLSNKFFTNERAKSAVQTDLNSLSGSITGEQAARQSAVSGINSRLGSLEADSVTRTYVDGQASGLDARLDSLESDSVTKTYVDGQVSGLDSRLDIIEGPSGQAGSIAKALVDAKSYTDQEISALVDSAPEVLNTLKELADALSGDASFASTIAGQIGSLSGAISTEIGNRQSDVSGLDARLDSLEADPVTKSYVDGQASGLDARLDSLEADATTKAYVDGQVSGLDARLDSLEADPVTKAYVDGAVSGEQSARQSADQALSGAITGEQAARQADVSGLDSRIDALEADPVTKAYVDGAISGEQSARQSADQALSGAITGEIAARQADVSGLDARLDVIEGPSGQAGSIAKALVDAKAYTDQEVSALVDSAPEVLNTLKELADALSGDAHFASTVAGQIGSLSGAISSEIGNRQSDVSGLDARLDALEADPVTRAYVDGAISGEQSARVAADLTFFKLDGSRTITGKSTIQYSSSSSSERAFLVDGLSGSQVMSSVRASSNSGVPTLGIERSRDNAGTPDYLLNGDAIGQVGFRAWDGSGYSTGAARIFAYAIENHTSSARGTKMLFQATAAGGTTKSDVMALFGDKVEMYKDVSVSGNVSVSGKQTVSYSTSSSSERAFLVDGLSGSQVMSSVRASSNSGVPTLGIERSRDNAGTPDYLLNGDAIGQVGFRAWDGSGYSTGAARIFAYAIENHTSSARGTKMLFQATAAGGTTKSDVMALFGDKVEMYKDVSVSGNVSVSGKQTVSYSTNSSSEYQLLVDSLTGQRANMALRNSQNAAADGSILIAFERSRDNSGTPDYLQSGDSLGNFAFRVWTGSGYSGRAQVAGLATEQHTNAAQGAKLVLRATPSGSTTRADVLEIYGDKVNFLKSAEVPVDWSLSRPADNANARGYAKMIFADFTDPSSNNQTQIKFDLRRNSSDATERLPLTLQTDHAIFGRGFSYRIIRKSANYTVPNSEPMQVAQAVNITYTLPVAPIQGQVHAFKDGTGSCNNSNRITIQANSGLVGSTIDGASSFQLKAPYESVSMMYDSTLNMWLLM